MHKHLAWALVLTMPSIALVSAPGCTPAPERARYTVDEYRQDKALRKEQFALCRNDPGTLGKTPDCINVMEAERIEGIGSFRDRFQPSFWSTKEECLKALAGKSEQVRAAECNKLPERAQ